MKKKPVFCLILAISLLFSLFTVPSYAQQDLAVSAGCSTLDAQLPLGGDSKILPSASGVILYERNTDTLVYAYGPDKRVNPSSMVKILSALVALENGDLDDIATVSREALNSVPIGSVSAELKRGEQLTLRDLLYCSVIASANDATAVLAEFIGGTQTAFVEMMNQKAAALGCQDSLFTNATGLNDDRQYSTVRDLAIITEAALENETFAEIFCTDQYTIPATNVSEERTVYTSNYMQTEKYLSTHYDNRVTGGKTAAATHTKRSLICTASIGTADYLCVVMDADTVMSEDNLSVVHFGSFVETELLLDYAQENFTVCQVLDDAQSYSQHKVSAGENDVVLAPASDIFTVLPRNYDPADLQFVLEANTDLFVAPIAQHDVLGMLMIRYRGIILGQCDMVAMNPVAVDGSVITSAATVGQTIQTPKESPAWLWLVIIGCSAILAISLTVLIGRMIRNARIRQLYRKRKRNRRRSQ